MREPERKISRAFNQVKIYPDIGVVVKTSSKMNKIRAEANWYRTIPNELKGFAPKFIELIPDSEELSLVMDYYPFQNLSEILLEGQDVDWTHILIRLLKVHKHFVDASKKYHKSSLPSKEDLVKFHIEKLTERVGALYKTSLWWTSLMGEKTITINGIEMKNLDYSTLVECIEYGKEYAIPSVVHGDYCFSNILYDTKTDCVKLVDPRGSFALNNTYSVFGDAQYDFAKLMHSFWGGYDLILGEQYFMPEGVPMARPLFELRIPENFQIARSMLYTSLMDKPVKERRYIIALHCSLFWSMIPLHYEDFKRQFAFYLRAVQLYNELLEHLD